MSSYYDLSKAYPSCCKKKGEPLAQDYSIGSTSSVVENYGSTITLYGALKNPPRRVIQGQDCYCRMNLYGKELHHCYPTLLCGDCDINKSDQCAP